MTQRHEAPPIDEVVATDLFKREVRRWADRIGVEVREIRIRPMKRKWASASTTGRLTFDKELLAEPRDKRAEVIVHELVHLKVQNHGPLFRNLVRSHLSEKPKAPVRDAETFQTQASLKPRAGSRRMRPR